MDNETLNSLQDGSFSRSLVTNCIIKRLEIQQIERLGATEKPLLRLTAHCFNKLLRVKFLDRLISSVNKEFVVFCVSITGRRSMSFYKPEKIYFHSISVGQHENYLKCHANM